MSKVTITVPPGFAKKLENYLNQTSIEAAEEIKDYAKTLCPVRSGALRDSIDIQKEGDDYTIGSDLPYSGIVEYGTMHQAPQPFMRPALNKVLSENQQ